MNQPDMVRVGGGMMDGLLYYTTRLLISKVRGQ